MSDWASTRLEDLAEITMGQSPPGDLVRPLGNGRPFLQGNAEFGAASPSPTNECDSAPRRVDAGVELISVRAPVGARNTADQAYGIGRGLAGVRFTGADPPFGRHALAAASLRLKRVSQGTTFAAINRRDLASMPILHPIAVTEQQRIAAILDTVDEAIHSTERLIAKLRRAQTGVVERILNDAAAHAPTTLLGQVASIAGGLTLSARRSVSDPSTVPYLRVANVQDGFIDTTVMKEVTVSVADVRRHLLRPGDVLMNEGGDFDQLGRGAVWDGRVEPCLHQNHVFRVRCDLSRLMPEYLALYSGSHRGKRFFLLSSKQSTNLATLNRSQLAAMSIPLPDIDVQARVEMVVTASRERLAAESARLRVLRDLRAGLTDDLLTGRVRTVPV